MSLYQETAEALREHIAYRKRVEEAQMRGALSGCLIGFGLMGWIAWEVWSDLWPT